ncbi:hypothetical protein PG985_004468 [Apiospora marii]|uniref:Trichothecene 3-O-acetyltransferase n=1 Tax=Apiospora marii TaxID=335849 RepID=A0ABR1S9E0_9PEZI
MAGTVTDDDSASPAPSPLSPLDWLMPRTYIRQMLCFPILPTTTSPAAGQSVSSKSEIVWTLPDGLAATAAQVPCLLSRVVSLARPHGAVGLSAPYQSVDSLFDIRDVSREYNYAALRDRGFPPDVLGRGGFAPEMAVGAKSEAHGRDEKPVFRARLSLVEGGFILGVAIHHSTTDITGFGALLKVWAANCRRLRDGGGDVDPTKLKDGLVNAAMLNRAAVRELGLGVADSDMPKTIPSVLFFQDGEPVPKPATTKPQPVFMTAIFRFSSDSLTEIKALAMDWLPSVAADVPWVSTGDVLTALLWSAVVAAEGPPPSTPSSHDDATSSTISIPVNFRARCEPPLSPDYLGAAFGRAAVSAPIHELVSMAALSNYPAGDRQQKKQAEVDIAEKATLLAKTAAAIRRAITDQVNARRIRAAVAYTTSRPDIAAMKRRPAEGIFMVSWADQGICALDWGCAEVGRCDAVRLGKMPGRRYPIVLPRLQDGGLEVIVSLETAAMERFRKVSFVRQSSDLRCLV